MLQWAITNSFETNGKIWNYSKEIEATKNNQMEIIEVKNIIIKVKHLLDGLKCVMKIIEDRISKLEDKTIEFLHSKQKRK